MNVSNTSMLFLVAMAFSLFASSARAHFSWLIVDDGGHAVYFFGESIADRTYHLPERLADVDVEQRDAEGKGTPIKLVPVESDDLVGRRSTEVIAGSGTLVASGSYGVYHGTKLTYYNQHLLGDGKTWSTKPAEDLLLQTILETDAAGLRVTLLWKGKPLADTDVKLFCSDGDEEAVETTGNDGKVLFDTSDIEAGLGAVMANFVDKRDSGKLGDDDYSSSTHYVTTTFIAPESIVGKRESITKSAASPAPKHADASATIGPSGLPELPETLTSFGGAIAGDVLYVYGGHTGAAHSYSVAEQSNHFYALSLTGASSKWETLAGGPRLQGLALVPHGKDVIRIGGFTAMNAEGEDHDLQSQADVSRYDVSAGHWESLPALPEPRSSHDAAVIGDQVYVVGGWHLSGEDSTEWHTTAWKLDLSDANGQWQPIAKPPTVRRALSLAAHNGLLYAVGGMKQKGGPTTIVEIYDPQTDRWTDGPGLPGSPMNGFGNASFSTGDDLIATTIRGNALKLSEKGDEWLQVAQVDPPRFFHRMLPRNNRSLLIVGGANMEQGKFTSIDQIDVQ